MWGKNSAHRLSRAFLSKYVTRSNAAVSHRSIAASHRSSRVECRYRYSAAPDGRGPPDLICLSYTHDDDYTDYKALQSIA